MSLIRIFWPLSGPLLAMVLALLTTTTAHQPLWWLYQAVILFGIGFFLWRCELRRRKFRDELASLRDSHAAMRHLESLDWRERMAPRITEAEAANALREDGWLGFEDQR